MGECPVCGADLPDGIGACPRCGAGRKPAGGDTAPWEVEMARMVAERERKSETAERLGRFGRPLPHWFLDGRPGCGAISLLVVLLGVATLMPSRWR